MPVLSVLIPTFNSHQTLLESIGSIDTRRAHEIIVTDDCSTDPEMISLLDELESCGVQVIRGERNQGPGPALQHAGEVASGTYLIELDSDDLFAAGALDRLIDALEADPALDVAWSDVQSFEASTGYKAMMPTLDGWYLAHLNGLPCCAMMRKSAWQQAGGWQVRRPGFHDWGMWIALAMSQARGKRIEGVMLHYRVRSDSLFHSSHSRYAIRRKATLATFPGLPRFRRRSWLKSAAPWRLKFLLPLLVHLPGDQFVRMRKAKALASVVWFKNPAAARARMQEVREYRG
jgi:glycosyltransferase involved in cell wall biosynthesis